MQHHYEGLWKGWALKIETFLGPEMARAKRVPFGPKKVDAPSNDVAPLKIITYHAIKTTGTLVVLCTLVLLCTVGGYVIAPLPISTVRKIQNFSGHRCHRRSPLLLCLSYLCLPGLKVQIKRTWYVHMYIHMYICTYILKFVFQSAKRQ